MNPQHNHNSFNRISDYELLKSLHNKQVKPFSTIPLEVHLQALNNIRASINSVKRDLHSDLFPHLVKLAKSYNSLLQHLPETLDHDFTPIIF